MTTTNPTLKAVPERIAAWPDPKLLPPKLRPLVKEYDTVHATLTGLAETYERLISPESKAEAAELDALAQAGAIRKGQTASSVGSPAADDLAACTKAAEAELVGAITAVNTITKEISETIAELWPDDTANGRQVAAQAVDRYRQSIAATVAARDEAVRALALPTFLNALRSYHPDRADGACVYFRPPNVNYGLVGEWVNPNDKIAPAIYERLLAGMADSITDAIPTP